MVVASFLTLFQILGHGFEWMCEPGWHTKPSRCLGGQNGWLSRTVLAVCSRPIEECGLFHGYPQNHDFHVAPGRPRHPERARQHRVHTLNYMVGLSYPIHPLWSWVDTFNIYFSQVPYSRTMLHYWKVQWYIQSRLPNQVSWCLWLHICQWIQLLYDSGKKKRTLLLPLGG